MIDQKDYKHYVVCRGKIESGWEFREDASDQCFTNLPKNEVGRLATRQTLINRGLDPTKDENWLLGKWWEAKQ